MSKKKALIIRPQSAPNGDINVTPLVDVVLVLLIIFMVVTPLLEKDIGVAMPSTEKVETMSEVPPDQVVVRIAETGALELNGAPVLPEALVESLKKKLEPKPLAEKVVFVVADDKASYAKLVMVLDGAKAAGASTLGMASDAPGQTVQ